MGLDKISKIIINLIYSNPEDKINNLFLFIVALIKNKVFCQYFDSHKYSKPIYLQLNLKAQKEKKKYNFHPNRGFCSISKTNLK